MSAAVYQITNMETGHFYIGSAVRVERRWWEHRSDLRKGQHHCKALQEAWNIYGEDAFIFEKIEEVEDPNQVQKVEDTYLLQHAGRPECYNVRQSTTIAPSFMPEVRQKISNSLRERYQADPDSHPRKGTTHSEETKELIRRKRKGKHAGENHYNWGKTIPDEVRKKIGDAQRGKPKAPGRVISEEGYRKIQEAAARGSYSHWKGRKHSEESKTKMSKGVLEITNALEFDSLTAALKHFGMTMPTLRRALLADKPITKGKFAGLWFRYRGLNEAQLREKLKNASSQQEASRSNGSSPSREVEQGPEESSEGVS